MSEHQYKYPLLVVHSVEEGRYYALLLNDKFPHTYFMTKRYSNQLGITPVDDVPDDKYYEIYQYAQQIYGDYDDS